MAWCFIGAPGMSAAVGWIASADIDLDAARRCLADPPNVAAAAHEKLKLRLARLLRQQYGASSEKLRAAIDQLELLFDDLEEQIAETTPPEPKQPPRRNGCMPTIPRYGAGPWPRYHQDRAALVLRAR
jgi:Transposase C of IS166 homeodomain